MAGFILMLAVLAICGLLFGKADTKKELLNQVGLDLSQNRYETKKEDEYRKYSIQAMKKVVDTFYNGSSNENWFLEIMSDKLQYALNGNTEKNCWGDYEYHPPIYLGVKRHYVEHAYRVIYRRQEDLKQGKKTELAKNVNFMDKKSVKHYCEKLWDKYQYPWPKNWMQNDSV